MIKRTLKPLLFCVAICVSCASFIYINSVEVTNISADVELSIEDAIPSDQPSVNIPAASIAKKIALVAKHFLFPTH